MIGHTSRRASLLLLVSAGVLVFTCGGAAVAAGNSISIRTPTNAKVHKNYSFTVNGFASEVERLYVFNDVLKCGPNPHVEHAALPSGHSANGFDYIVTGSFKKIFGGRSPKAGTLYICAYLVQISQPFNPKNGVLLRTGKGFKVG